MQLGPTQGQLAIGCLGGEEMVEGNRRMMQWMAIERNLAPDDLRMKMPKQEWRG